MVESLTAPLENLSISPIVVNFAPYKNCRVEEVNVLRKLLIDDRKDVVFFGEGNFSFSVAFAALRGSSWNGITSTCLSVETDFEPQLSEAKLLSIKLCITNGKKLGDGATEILRRITAVLDLTPPTRPWQFGIDATDNKLVVKGKVVWFQCPWTFDRDDVGELIKKYLRHMATKQELNDYALIGIANSFPYTTCYMLGDMMEDEYQDDGSLEPKLVGTPEYKFVGADKALIKELLQYGYRHEGKKDIHEDIFRFHVTLVFQRTESVVSEP